MKLSEAIKPISYLKAHASDIMREVADSDKTYVITQNGEAKAVLQGVEAYEQTRESLALLKMLAQSTKSLSGGRIKSAGKAFRDVEVRVKDMA